MNRKNWKKIGKVFLMRGKELIEEYDSIDQYVYWDYNKYTLIEGPTKWAEENLTKIKQANFNAWWFDRNNHLDEFQFSYYLVDELNLVVPLGVIESHYSYWKPLIRHRKNKWDRPAVEYRKYPIPGVRKYSGCSNRMHKMKPYNSTRSGGRVKQKKVIEEWS